LQWCVRFMLPTGLEARRPVTVQVLDPKAKGHGAEVR